MDIGTKFKAVIGCVSKSAGKIILLSGKYYYDVIAERELRGLVDLVAVIRIEELCPFPWLEVKRILSEFTCAEEFLWVQEEPRNQGAWDFVERRLNQVLPKPVRNYEGFDFILDSICRKRNELCCSYWSWIRT